MATDNKKFIVVEDPDGDYWEGALIDVLTKPSLEDRGVVMLPVIVDTFKLSGVGGYHKRAWGSGWPMNTVSPRIFGPLTMYCRADAPVLHWAAKVLPDDAFLARIDRMENERSTEALPGYLRIVSDTGQAIAQKAGVTPRGPAGNPHSNGGFEVRELTKNKLTKDGAFILSGSAVLRCQADAHYGFALFGMAPGLRLIWSAVSQSLE